MNIFKIIKIRRQNKIKREINKQRKRKQCCESCRYCYIAGETFGYVYFECRLDEIDFEGSPKGIYEYKCNNYSPCRDYKKYLKYSKQKINA